jgi:hypothetical protein
MCCSSLRRPGTYENHFVSVPWDCVLPPDLYYHLHSRQACLYEQMSGGAVLRLGVKGRS